MLKLLFRFVCSAVLLFFPGLFSFAQTAKPLVFHNPVQDKNFYLLSLFEENPAVRKHLTDDPTLDMIYAERQRTLQDALNRRCNGDAACLVRSLLWSDEEIQAASRELGRLYAIDPALRSLVENKLRPSGAYVLDQNRRGDVLLMDAWNVCAHGLNHVLSVYGLGVTPYHGEMDLISFDVNSAEFQKDVGAIAAEIASQSATQQLYFLPTLKAALDLLALNHRDEAGRHEPMENGVNKAVVAAIPSIDWKKYPYTVIVVPGAGPENPNVALSAGGYARLALAMQAYRAGKAPLLLVSGGYVHPKQTRFSEAIEMKRVLMQNDHVPEAAILVDPHARHTTTNIRNAAREIFRHGIPMNRPALIVSDAGQISAIASQAFVDRCLRDLGYLPYKIVGQPSSTSVVFLPQIESLEQDPLDPLDP